jgi:hypothetical protein
MNNQGKNVKLLIHINWHLVVWSHDYINNSVTVPNLLVLSQGSNKDLLNARRKTSKERMSNVFTNEIAIYAPRALQRWLRPENDESSSRALAREVDIVRWAYSLGDAVVHTRFYFLLYVFFKKKMASLQLWIDDYYALLLFPGCYGHVYVFRILGVIMQLY